jgi:hypothetical protein
MNHIGYMMQLGSGRRGTLIWRRSITGREKRGDGIAPPKVAKNCKGRDFRELPKIYSRIQAGMRRRRA